MANKLYIIVKRGVFIRGIAGITDSRERADLWIKTLKADENDDYHSFEALPFVLNEMVDDPEKASERSDEVLSPYERMRNK